MLFQRILAEYEKIVGNDDNRGQEVARFRTSKVNWKLEIRTLNEIDPHRLDSHALVQIALGARELEAPRS